MGSTEKALQPKTLGRMAAAVLVAALLGGLPASAGAASGHHRGHDRHGRAARHHHGHRHAHAGKAKAGKHKKSKEHKVSASLTLTVSPPSEQLPQTNQINLFVPKRFHSAGAKMPKCSASALVGKGPRGCPKKTVVGSGTSIGYTILGGAFVREHLTIDIFNGPKGRLLSWVEGKSPVAIEEVVEGIITKPKGYGLQMAFTIPRGLLEPLIGASGWLQSLHAELSGKAGWLRTSSCPEHPWSLKANLGFTALQGEDALRGITLETKIACVK